MSYSNLMIRALFAAVLLTVGSTSHGTPRPLPWETMPLVGESTLKVAVWDIYHASLYAPEARYQPARPFALKLLYLRDFSKKNLIKETRKQLEELDLVNHRNAEQWFEKLDTLWVDVSKGDAITLLSDAQEHAHFYFNDRYLGSIADAEFARRFSAIWLSERSSRPEMRRQLIGEF